MDHHGNGMTLTNQRKNAQRVGSNQHQWSPIFLDYYSPWNQDFFEEFQDRAEFKKHELRGVWVTTVRNSDFLSEAVYANGFFDVNRFKEEYLSILNRCKQLKLNAIFFQVRPEGDAFYRSGVNPWSVYLTGKQGVEPNWGDFDPLNWIINITHLNGIEFHAWLNPYRLTPSTTLGTSKESLLQTLSSNHYARRHPDWVYFFNGQLYLNPGVPAVNDYFAQTVQELLENYEVDAIHLDDFFYPYSYVIDGKTVSFADESPDYETYLTYGQSNQTIDQWREYNVNNLIYQLSQVIHQYDAINGKSVAFGVSPFGVWGSAEETGDVGSETSPFQLSSLSEYVNSKLWIDSGWLDYIVPQNYWSFNDALSPFGVVANWWNQAVEQTNTQLYMGLGLYLYDEDAKNPSWQNPEEIVDQIRYSRRLSNNKGFIFFTYHNLLPEKSQTQALKQALTLMASDVLGTEALVPPRPTLQVGPTETPKNFSVSKCEGACHMLTFEDSKANNVQYYAIYRATGEHVDIANSRNILDVIGKVKGETHQFYRDDQVIQGTTYTYAVTALSQAQVESLPVTATFFSPVS